MTMQYNEPGITPSTIGTQFNEFDYQKKALMDTVKDQYFQPLADVTSMPKHFGKTIKKYYYVPLLDDRNVNDQGINAAGATIANGNLYGSSKDIGTIVAAIPELNESGGRVNRVGVTRLEREGSISNLGFFAEYTEDSLQFDTDAMLYEHMTRELLRGANELTEDLLQIDLLNGASTIYFSGAATSDITMTGEDGATASIVDYDDLQRLQVTLNDNRTPKQTKMIKGSTMTDTRTIRDGRVMYIGSAIENQIRNMVNAAGNEVFVPAHQYADASNIMNGEIGAIAGFRFVVVPEMHYWAGAGAAVVTNDGYQETDDNYDIHPMLVVGEESFTTIGFASGGNSFKFKIIKKAPGAANADRTDPYGKTGFFSIEWWYGTMILRPERLAIIKTLALA